MSQDETKNDDGDAELSEEQLEEVAGGMDIPSKKPPETPGQGPPNETPNPPNLTPKP